MTHSYAIQVLLFLYPPYFPPAEGARFGTTPVSWAFALADE